MEKRRGKLSLPEKSPDGAVNIAGLFLSEGMGIEEETRDVYDLRSAFSSSRKNRSYRLYITVASFSIALMAVTFGLTSGIQRDIDRTRAGITDFRDLNLAELLESLKRAESELTKADEKIALSKKAMELQLESIRRNADREIRKVEESGLGQAEKNRILERIRLEHDKKMKAAEKSHEIAMRESHKEAEEARRKIDLLEKKAAMDDSGFRRAMDLQVKSAKTEEDARLEKQRKEYQAVLENYGKELKSAAERQHEAEDLIGLYKKALIYYARTRGEHGCVIDPGSSGRMLVDINPYLRIKKEDRAYVLNQEGRILALVELHPDGMRLRARIIKRMLPDEIQPFDKILLIKTGAE